MKPKNDLFLLIKSMTKTEKGYFKKFAGLHGSSKEGNYIKLFNFIDGMDAYDEALVKKAFSKEKFVKQLGVTKNYLFRLILRTLSNFHRENIPALHICHLLAEDRILRQRRIVAADDTQLAKAASLATEFSEPQFIPAIEWAKYESNITPVFSILAMMNMPSGKKTF